MVTRLYGGPNDYIESRGTPEKDRQGKPLLGQAARYLLQHGLPQY